MHPALSIIAFTTVSGLGYGLAVMLGAGLLDPAATATRIAYAAALILIAAGLSSSTLHLGNPQRAWRAFSQWRSSWLSREGVMAVVTFFPLAALALVALLQARHIAWLGALAAVLSLATVYCTAMIYASLRAVPRWHTGWTPASYLLFALSSGGMAAALAAVAGGLEARYLLPLTLLFLILAWFAKLKWRHRANTMRPASTPETATGLGRIGRVRLFEPPHMTENYLTREMGFVIARKHASKLFRLAFAIGAVLPFLLLSIVFLRGAVGGLDTALVALALAGHMAGLFVERWLFFAEARHVVMNYYGG